VREAVRAREPFIKEFQRKNPTIGILVVIYFENGIFSPPPQLSVGMTRVQAQAALGPLRSGKESSESFWIEPLMRADIADYITPFPRVALATFVGREIFQDVVFKGAGGFDDDGESDLGRDPRGLTARFWILRPPPRVGWYFGGRHTWKDIDIVSRRLADGSSVECVDLDPTPFSVGNDSAFMAFPADGATEAKFLGVPATSDKIGALRRYDLDRVRWIAPERARRLGV
jgi:hypothetical protein